MGMEKALTWLSEQQRRGRPAGARPQVTLTYAQSLDGSLTTQRGERLTLSGEESMALTHALRAAHDAILVGRGTVLADDPRLTVRRVPGEHPQPVVLDSRLRLSPGAALFRHPKGLWIATTQAASERRRARMEAAGARVFRFPADAQGRVPFAALLDRLGELGVSNVMVEGGARVIAGLIACGLADLLVLTIAPIYVGGLSALESLLPRPFTGLRGLQSFQSGQDLVVYGELGGRG